MKRLLLSCLVFSLLGFGLADPFVWPDAWNVDAGDVVTGSDLNLATQSGSATFNPITRGGSDIVFDLSFTPAALVTRDPVTRDIIPYAAETVEVSEDGLTIDATLREELQWSDGTPLTAQDYFFYYQAVTDSDVESPRFDDFTLGDELVGLEATGERSLRFTFPAPDRDALGVVAALFPAPDHVLGEIYREGGAEALKNAWDTDTDPSELVWAGPFVMTEYVPDERYTFEANPYFGEWNVDESGTPLPYTAQRQYTIAELPAQLNLYVAGQTDSYGTSSLDDFSVVLNAIDNGDIDAEAYENNYQSPSMTFYTFNWNKADEPFKQALFRDKRFRQAMSHLTDREAILDLVIGLGEPAYGPVSPAYEQWVTDDMPKFEYDPEAALALLGELGFTETNSEGWLIDEEGNEIEFTLATIASNDKAMDAVQVITDGMREAGVKAEPVGLEFSVLVDQLTATGESRPFDAIYIFFGCCTEEWPFFEGIFKCSGEFHMWTGPGGECANAEEERINQLLTEGRKLLDDEAAQQVSYEILNSFAELQPMIFTTFAGINNSWLDEVGGEFPPELVNSLNGPRDFRLTFKAEE